MNRLQQNTVLPIRTPEERVRMAEQQKAASFREYQPGDRVLVETRRHQPAVPAVVESSRRTPLCATVIVRFEDGSRSCVTADRVKEDRG